MTKEQDIVGMARRAVAAEEEVKSFGDIVMPDVRERAMWGRALLRAVEALQFYAALDDRTHDPNTRWTLPDRARECLASLGGKA